MNARDSPRVEPIALDAVASRLTEPWQPVNVVVVNDAILRMVRLEGSFPWHVHAEDELFLCWRGSLRIEIENEAAVDLEAGELHVVRRGLRHRPVARRGPAHALLIERPSTRQYGKEARRR